VPVRLVFDVQVAPEEGVDYTIDFIGTRAGFDCEMTAAVANAVNIPVIASGGAGALDHFADVFTRGRADAGGGSTDFMLVQCKPND
jgi:imidazole glycerol phosphate synthase subunit HisF